MYSLRSNTSRLAIKSGLLKRLEAIGVTIDEQRVTSCEEELASFNKETSSRFKFYLGYPNSIYSGLLPNAILNKLLINIGDWRGNKYLGPNTHTYEEEAMLYLKEIFHFPEGQKEWGNSCTGSSEAVLSAIVYARSLLKAKTGMKPVVIASSEAHYCAKKNAFIAGLDFMTVKTGKTAGMDIADLRSILFGLTDVPVIVVASCGTTVREGFDPIKDISDLLDSHFAGSYLHIDAALSGFTAPFLDEVADDFKPRFFKNVGSISVSLHKFVGVNRPSALVLGIDQSSEKMPIMQRVDYIDATDGTPSGSRNGHPVLAFAMLYRILGRDGFGKIASYCLFLANYLATKLRNNGVDVFHNKGALTVFMPRPSDEIVDKYTLACAENGAHVITMQHVTVPLLDAFITDYVTWHRAQSTA
jgi:histidine decarboxylase